MTRTVLLVVDDDPAALGIIEGELSRRYGSDYSVAAHGSAEDALAALRKVRDDGGAVAVLFADLWMPSMTGIEFLAAAHALFPTAKRALLIDWGDVSSRRGIVDASALGQMDCFIPKPIHSPDETFHEVVTELLAEWPRHTAAGGRASASSATSGLRVAMRQGTCSVGTACRSGSTTRGAPRGAPCCRPSASNSLRVRCS